MRSHSGKNTLQVVVSGGQTGVDRGALDAAIDMGVEHGGWCPRGRLSEDGTIPFRYRLRETETAEYPERTEKNVIDSDGTLILYRKRLYGGTQLTRRLARRHGKPCHLIDLADSPDATAVVEWIVREGIQRLNVAGPRESTSPGVGQEACGFLCCVFQGLLAK
jgi:hypothetical protein